MDEPDDDKLPLHDEAEARSDWRGGETIIDRGSQTEGLPASEVDNAATPAEDDEAKEESLGDTARLGLRPPD